ncbi:MAG: phosphatidylserine decarboxylase [Pseudomonadota bacterium]
MYKSVIETCAVPIHRAGWPFIIGAAVGGLILSLLWDGFAGIGLALAFGCLFFFRDPIRTVPQRDGLVIAPADGRVIMIEHDVSWPDELVTAPRDGLRPTRVSIFLSVLDVHVIRNPIAGTLQEIVHRPGAFVNASLDKASEDNERVSTLITLPDGGVVGSVLIAGLIARRIVPNVITGQALASGERIGIIRFGSRVDVYLPAGTVPMVGIGQRMVGGETIMADLKLSTKSKAVTYTAI